MRHILGGALAVSLLLTTAQVGFAACDPMHDPDKTAIANARAAADAACANEPPPTGPRGCNTPGVTHGQYVSCVVHQLNANPNLPKNCRGAAKRCAAKSTCGKPGFVTCCVTNPQGKSKCRITQQGACPGTVGSCTSCCDACPAPGSGPSCPS